MILEAGAVAPEFTLLDQTRTPRSLSEFAGRKLLVVFIPFPFTSTCEGELCTIRDNLSALAAREAEVVVITCDTMPANKRWAEDQGFTFPILSDYWPHGATARAYGCFNEAIGTANRASFAINEQGIISEVITTDSPRQPRNFDDYTTALS